MTLTRRTLLEQIGAIGGAGAAYAAMEALGLAIPTPAGAENFQLARSSGTGPSVVILGAGIAGLVSAYELRKAGYRVTVLEARDRIGGRSWTIRGGDRIVQTGRPDQHAAFSPGLYFNAGAARIPSTHRVILGYARRFGVPLEVFVNTNRNASWDFAGKVHQERRMVNDMRGHVGELLAKAIDSHALDRQVSKGELELMRQFIAAYAQLDGKGQYKPFGSSGYAAEAGAYNQRPVPLPPLTIDELLPGAGDLRQRGSIVLPYLFEHVWDMQPTMLQPAGGMDRIAHAIYDQVRPSVHLNTPIKAIRRNGDRVRVEHGPGTEMIEADYCVCTLPLTALKRIPTDFSASKKSAIAGAPGYQHSVKVAFESPRFWETDDNIYGGLNENVIYPSSAYNSPKGVLIGAYCAGWTRRENPDAFANLSHEERFRICRESVEALHPAKSRLLNRAVTVAWGLTPYSEGVTAMWPGGPINPGDRGPIYQELLKPEGPIVFAGEHLSYQPAWQEGAATSAHEALKLVSAMARERAGAAAAA
jgi:monoamine oxidase